MSLNNERVNVNEQVSLILDIANQLRGPFKEEEYEKVIIPMTICRRFECILDPTKNAVVEAFKKGITNEIRLKHKSGLPIYNTSDLTLNKLLDDPNKIQSNFKEYLNSFNPLGVSIFTRLDFFKTIDKLADKKKLYTIIKKFAKTDLTIDNVSSMQMGYIMEEIIRKYSENASAGDHFTPREVIRCLTKLLLAEGCDDLNQDGKIVTLGDFACGTGGMLYEGYDMIKRINDSAEIELFGQDNNDWYSAIALAETIIRGQNPENIKLVDSTLVTDAHESQKMRLILMNPPFGQSWSKDKVGEEQYKKILEQNTKANGWYIAGLPKTSDMQLLFWQFAINKLQKNGRAAIICNGSPLFGTNMSESNIRRWLLEKDYVEAIIQFCPDLFYNTSISIYALIFNKNKSDKRKNKIQLIDASNFCYRLSRGLGYKRNAMKEKEHIDEIVKLYCAFEENEYCKIYDKYDFYSKEIPVYQPYRRDFAITVERIKKVIDAPSFIKLYEEEKYQELLDTPFKTQSQIDLIKKMQEGKELQNDIIKLLSSNVDEDNIFMNREEFTKHIKGVLSSLDISANLMKGIVNSLSKHNPKADCYTNKKGVKEIDTDLNDCEIIPYKTDVEEFFKKEVYPYVPEAWYVLPKKEDLKIWCDINFSKIFYKEYIPESSDDILARIIEIEKSERSFKEVIKDE